MSRNMGCVNFGIKMLALAVAIVFILILPLTLLGRDMAKVIFSPEKISTILRSELLESGFVTDVAAESFLTADFFEVDESSSGDLKPMFQYLSEAEREEILVTLLPAEWIDAQLEGIVHAFFTWIDSEQVQPRIAIDLQPFKQGLLRGGLRRIIDTLIDSWPSCTTDEVEVMAQELLRTGQLPIEVCEPPEPYRSQVMDLAIIELGTLIRDQPNKISLSESLDTPAKEIVEIRGQLRFLRSLMMWAWFLPVSLLGIIMILRIRSISDVGQWWGIPLLVGGLLSLAIFGLINAGRQDLIADSIPDAVPLGTPFYWAVEAITLGLFIAVVRLAFFHALLIAVAGFVLWLITRLVGKRGKPQKALIQKTDDAGPGKQVSGIPAPPPVPPFGSGLEDEDNPPSGIFG